MEEVAQGPTQQPQGGALTGGGLTPLRPGVSAGPPHASVGGLQRILGDSGTLGVWKREEDHARFLCNSQGGALRGWLQG